MSTAPSIRIFMILAALSLAFCASVRVSLLCAVPIATLYLLVGEGKLLILYARPSLVFLTISAALWFMVYLDFSTLDCRGALLRLEASNCPLNLSVRMMVASGLAILALGSVPDGAVLALAKSLGLSINIAAAYASARFLVGTVSESLERSTVSLKAHGVITGGRTDMIRHLTLLLGLTWTSSLDLVSSRGRIKWERNGFLKADSPAFAVRPPSIFYHNICCATTAAFVATFAIGSLLWR